MITAEKLKDKRTICFWSPSATGSLATRCTLAATTARSLTLP
jgi:hypothetical protein